MTEALTAALGHNGAVGVLTALIGLTFIGVNIFGAHASGQAENVITMAKIVVLSIFIMFGLAQVFGEPQVAAENFRPLLPNGFGGVLAAMGLTFIAFEGYDLIATVSEEVKDPHKTIPRAILWSLGITMVIYLLVVFVCLGAVPSEGGVPTWQLLGDFGELGVVEAAGRFMPSFGVALMLGGGLFATLSALNATILASSRVAFSMGRDWMLPNALSRIHSLRRTPVVAITVSGVLFIFVAIFMPLETIGTASSLLFLLCFTLVNLSLILYRSRSKSDKPRFRVPLYPVTPILGIVTCAGLAGYQLFNQLGAALLAAGWIGVGLAIYLMYFSRKARIADVHKTMETPELRALRKVRPYRVLVPVSNPSQMAGLIDLASIVASASQGDVIALSVVELPDVTAYADAGAFVNQSQQLLADAQEIAMKRSVPFASILKLGRRTSVEIRDVAAENQCDLILMGYKRDLDPLDNSVIHRVVSHTSSDVAILKWDPIPIENIRRILVPIAGREYHRRMKVRFIRSLHKHTGCRVTLMTVVPPGVSKARKQRAMDQLKAAEQIFQFPEIDKIVVEDHEVSSAIVSQARDHDLVVLGMKKEPLFRSFFFGTISQQIAGQVQCPTLLVKTRSRGASRRSADSQDQ